MPKKTISDLITTSPQWNVPSKRELDTIEAGKTSGFVRSHLEGLRRIQIEAKTKISGKAAGIFQSFELKFDNSGQPLAAAHDIALVVRARGIRHAFESKVKTTYRVWFHQLLSGAEHTSQHQFTIDPRVDNDYLESDEETELDGDEQDKVDDDDDKGDREDDDDDEIEDGDEGDDEDEEDDDDDGDREDDDDDDDDEENDEDDRSPRIERRDESRAPLNVARTSHPSPLPPASRVGTQALPSRDPEPSRMPPSMSVHPSVDYARQHGLEVKPEAVHMQVNPDFLVAFLDYADRRTERIFRPMMREMRLGMKALRRESSALARDSRMNARRAEANSSRQIRLAHRRAAQAEQRLRELSELNQKHYENFQLIAQQGWTAFRNSMDREAQTFVMQREYDKALLGQQLMFERSTDRTGAAGGIMSSALPMGAALASAWFSNKGNKGMADLFATLAKAFAPKALPDDEGDEEDENDEGDDDEGDVIDTKYSEKEANVHSNSSNGHARSSSTNGASPNTSKFDERRQAIETPAIYYCRKLLGTMDEGQTERVRKILPVTAWVAINEAAGATLEEAALTSLVTLKTMVEANPLIVVQVQNELNNEQKRILMQLYQIASGSKPKPRGMPKRPSASTSS